MNRGKYAMHMKSYTFHCGNNEKHKKNSLYQCWDKTMKVFKLLLSLLAKVFENVKELKISNNPIST